MTQQHFPHYEIFETIGEEGFQWRYRGPAGELVSISASRFRTYGDCMDSLNKMRQADDVALYVPTRFALARPVAFDPPRPAAALAGAQEAQSSAQAHPDADRFDSAMTQSIRQTPDGQSG